MKGTLATTNFGQLVLESILGADGNLYVPSRTISSIFSTPQKHLSRELKAILGEGSSTPQIELDNEKHENLPTRLTCIPLSDFGKVQFYALASELHTLFGAGQNSSQKHRRQTEREHLYCTRS